MLRRILMIGLIVSMVSVVFPGPGITAETVTIGIVCELTGSGATHGAGWLNGVLLAVDEINADGGILGRKIKTFTLDTRTEPPASVAAMRKAVSRKPFAVLGTLYSSSTIVNMHILEKAGIPQFTGSASPGITQQGNQNIFRCEFNTDQGFQKIAKWLTEVVKVKKMALIYVNSEYGKGGRDILFKLLEPKGVNIVADLATDPGQTDFTGELARVKRSGADTLFIFSHSEENARILMQVQDMGMRESLKIVGYDTLLTPSCIRLAKEAANGAQGHVVLSAVAKPLKAMADRYRAKHGVIPDHDAIKGYIGMNTVKAIVDEIGAFDQQKIRDTLRDYTLCVKDHPGLLLDVYYDDKGNIDRESFLVEVQNEKHVITGILPPLHPEKFRKCK